MERQEATPDEGLRCYRWDQYGALESRSKAIIWLTIFSFGGGWVGLVSNSQSLASAASRSFLSVVPPYSICLLMVRSLSSFGALKGHGSPFAWLEPIRQGHVVQVVGLKKGNDDSICQPSECHVLRPSMQPFRSGWTMRAREHGGWLELLRVRRSARCQGAQSAP